MKRPRSHQIDEEAQRVFQNALPSSWVVNKQENDYAKDYLVEVGHGNGDLTGTNFFVQLKGHGNANFSKDRLTVRHTLRHRYAKYYLDKVKDLPVFLVVIDTTRKEGWWLFLQPVLQKDQGWRKQKSFVIELPTANSISDVPLLQAAIEDAKKWMRIAHPESIQDSIAGHKQRLIATDPRFDVKVGFINEEPRFQLLAKEPVSLQFTMAGEREIIKKKFDDLINKGLEVAFQPGEVKISGSALFEQFEHSGGKIQSQVCFPGTVTLITIDETGNELGRLSELSGQYTGGQLELRFEGTLARSPLTLKIGPLGEGIGGSVSVSMHLLNWNGQRLLQLAYFDQIKPLFASLPHSVSTKLECRKDGNVFFSITLPLQMQSFAKALSKMFESLWKGRQIAQRFNVNPVWTLERWDEDTIDNVNELYAIFFGNGWSRRMKNARITAQCERDSFKHSALKKADNPGLIRLVSDEVQYDFCGEFVSVGTIVREFTLMSCQLLPKDGTPRRNKKSMAISKKGPIGIEMLGTEGTVMTVYTEEQARLKDESK